MSIIDIDQVRDLGSRVLLVDVRTPGEYETAHIPGAVNLPIDQIKHWRDDLEAQAAGRPIVLICRSGQRARQAQRVIGGLVMTGGMVASVLAGLWFGPAVILARLAYNR